ARRQNRGRRARITSSRGRCSFSERVLLRRSSSARPFASRARPAAGRPWRYLGAVSENSAPSALGPPPLPHAHHLRVERTARYYTLGAEGAEVRAIWFVLHGYGQLAGSFVRFFADIAKLGALVAAREAWNRFSLVSPESAPARERPVGATWMTREDRESEVSDYVEYLDALSDEIIG